MRFWKPKTLGLAGLVACTAMLAIGAFGAAAASAAGPVWVVKGAELAAGAKKTIKSKNVGILKLKSAAGTIECESETNTGELIGGTPGTDTAKIKFEKCFREGSAKECTVRSNNQAAGLTTIGEFTARTVLAYPEPRGTEGAALEAFVPEGWQGKVDTFVTLIAEGKNCGLLPVGEAIEVIAGGEEIKEVKGEMLNKRCGQLAEVGKIEAGAFVKTASGAASEHGGLKFLSPPIAKAEIEEKGAFVKKTCKLEVLTKGVKIAAEEIGVAEIETEPRELFGWKN